MLSTTDVLVQTSGFIKCILYDKVLKLKISIKDSLLNNFHLTQAEWKLIPHCTKNEVFIKDFSVNVTKSAVLPI